MMKNLESVISSFGSILDPRLLHGINLETVMQGILAAPKEYIEAEVTESEVENLDFNADVASLLQSDNVEEDARKLQDKCDLLGKAAIKVIIWICDWEIPYYYGISYRDSTTGETTGGYVSKRRLHVVTIDKTDEENMSEDQLEFAVFCIENVAAQLKMKGNEFYLLLTGKGDILNPYILPCYETLHTQGIIAEKICQSGGSLCKIEKYFN